MILIREISLHPDCPNIESELLRARQYFGADEYNENVLAFLNADKLTINMPEDLPTLKYTPSVKTLVVGRFDRPAADLNIITELPQLKRLRINLDSILPASRTLFFSRLASSQIRSLELLGSQYDDLSFLPAIPSLTTLLITGKETPIRLTGIKQNSHISELSISRCSEVATTQELNAMPKLRVVEFRGVRKLNLTGLDLSGRHLAIGFYDCGGIDVSPLAGAPYLTIWINGDTSLQNTKGLVGVSVYKSEPRISL
jgi:hypothetical protein